MSEPDHKTVASEEERSATRSYGPWIGVAVGAVWGAAVGWFLAFWIALRVEGDQTLWQTSGIVLGIAVGGGVRWLTQSTSDSESKGRPLISFRKLAWATIGAIIGALFGYLAFLGRSDAPLGSLVAAVFLGAVGGVIISFIAGMSISGNSERYFARWAGKRGWTYQTSASPFEDTPFLLSGDRRETSDYFSGFWPELPAVIYRFKRVDELATGTDESNYIVLHLTLADPVIDLLQIWPRSRAADLKEKVLPSRREAGEEIDLESVELAQCYRVSGSPGRGDDVRRLLTPSAIEKLLGFHHGLLAGVDSYFEVQGAAAAFLVEELLDTDNVDVIEELLALWKPIADWLVESSAPPSSQTPELRERQERA